MKELKTIELHGSRQGKATGWQLWSGFALLKFTDGTQHCCGDISFNDALLKSKELGHNTTEFERRQKETATLNPYPPKPESAELYQHHYGYEKPVNLGEWSWTTTFGRWGRIVTFADGWHGFTYPKTR